jgi:hypothetical protein
LPFAFEEIAEKAIFSFALFSGSDVSIRTFLTFCNKHSAISLTIFIYGFFSFKKEKQLCYLQKDTSTSNFKLPFTTSLQYKMTQKVQK